MSTDLLLLAGISLANYLVGSIPFSYLIAMAKGVDLKAVGSGNVGATNVARSLGYAYGAMALLLDLLKGVAGALLTLTFNLPVYASAFAVFGHNWSVYLRFKAGKGVATTLGILLVLHWPAFLITLGVWGLVALLTRYVSLSSVGALLSAPVTLYLWNGMNDGVVLMLVLSLISLFQHRDNFRKFFAGTENKIGI